MTTSAGASNNTGGPSSLSPRTLTQPCPAGQFIVGGGAFVSGPAGVLDSPPNDVVLTASKPAGGGPTSTAWTATARETDPIAGDWRLTVRPLCAPLNAGPPA